MTATKASIEEPIAEIYRQFRALEEYLHDAQHDASGVEYARSKLDSFQSDVRRVVARVACPFCTRAVISAEFDDGSTHSKSCPLGQVLRCRY